MAQPVKFYFDILNQSSRALYIFLEASKIPFEAVPISTLKGEHLTGEYRDKVNGFRKVPAIIDHGMQVSENTAIFRHLNREKLAPEHWYPRRNGMRSRIDDFLEWQQRNMAVSSTNYFQEKWLVPYLNKRYNENAVSSAVKGLDNNLDEFESMFLNSKKFLVGNNISYADLVAICEIDQPKFIGYNPFKNRAKLQQWYERVREELGPYYKEIAQEFKAKLKNAEKQRVEALSLKQ